MKQALAMMFLAALFAAPVPSVAVDPHRPGAPSVAFDPAPPAGDAGGWDAAYDIASRTADRLEAHGVVAHLSRDRGERAAGDTRLARVKQKGADGLLYLRTAAGTQACVQITAPRFPEASGKKPAGGKNVNESMMRLWRVDQERKGQSLAASLARSLRKSGAPLCGEVRTGPDPLFEAVVIPAAIVDVMMTQAMDASAQNRIVTGLGDGLREHFSSQRPGGRRR